MFFSSLVPTVVHSAISISVNGGWYETIDKNDLTSGAGSNLPDTYTSVSNEVTISISGTTGPEDSWRVEVGKSDDTWHQDLRPWIRRTSDGIGGTVDGGTSLQQVTDVNNTFFTGSGDITGINIQVRLTGVSIHILPALRATTLYYTVTDM